MRPPTLLALLTALVPTTVHAIGYPAVEQPAEIDNRMCPWNNRIPSLFQPNSRCGGRYRGPKPNATNPALPRRNTDTARVEAARPENIPGNESPRGVSNPPAGCGRCGNKQAKHPQPVVSGAVAEPDTQREQEAEVILHLQLPNPDLQPDGVDTDPNPNLNSPSEPQPEPKYLTKTTIISLTLAPDPDPHAEHRAMESRLRSVYSARASKRAEDGELGKLVGRARAAAEAAGGESSGGEGRGKPKGGEGIEIQLKGKPLANVPPRSVARTVDFGGGFTGFPKVG